MLCLPCELFCSFRPRNLSFENQRARISKMADGSLNVADHLRNYPVCFTFLFEHIYIHEMPFNAKHDPRVHFSLQRMYLVADDCFQPFASDQNGVDLDSIFHEITSKVLEVSGIQQNVFIHLQSSAASPPSWMDIFCVASQPAPPITAEPQRFYAFRVWLRLLLVKEPVWKLSSLAFWAEVPPRPRRIVKRAFSMKLQEPVVLGMISKISTFFDDK